MDSLDAEYTAGIVEDRSRIKQENKRLKARVKELEDQYCRPSVDVEEFYEETNND